MQDHPERQQALCKYGDEEGVVGEAGNFMLHAAERRKAERRVSVTVSKYCRPALSSHRRGRPIPDGGDAVQLHFTIVRNPKWHPISRMRPYLFHLP